MNIFEDEDHARGCPARYAACECGYAERVTKRGAELEAASVPSATEPRDKVIDCVSEYRRGSEDGFKLGVASVSHIELDSATIAGTDPHVAPLLAALSHVEPRADEELAVGILKLTKTVRYLVGIAEFGEGRPMLDDETAEQFVLRYVQRLEQELRKCREVPSSTKPLKPVAWLYEEEVGTHRVVLFERAMSGMYHYGSYKETPLYAAPSSAIAPLKTIRDCVRIDQHGDFIVMFGEPHDREDVKQRWDTMLRDSTDGETPHG